MSINCSEINNLNNSIDFFNSTKFICDELVKYIRTYKQLTIDYSKKLSNMQSSFAKKLSKTDNKSMEKIIAITNKLVELIGDNIGLIKLSAEELETKVKEFELDLKTKFDNLKQIQKKAQEQNKILINNNNDINKARKNYIDSMTKCEEIISKYYSDKKIIDDNDRGLTKKMNVNDYNIIKDKLKNEMNDMNNSIKVSKSFEKIYTNLINDSSKIHDVFVQNYNKNYYSKIKSFNIDISNKIKNLLLSFYLSFKNSYRQPMVTTDININSLNTIDEGKETENILNSLYKNDNPLQNITPMNYKLKAVQILKENKFFENNDVNINSTEDELKNEDGSIEQNKYVSILEDGFSQLQYISNSSLFKTLKTIFKNFKLIEKNNIDFEIEEIKFKTQEYILKIESNMNAYPYAKNGIQDKNDIVIYYKRNELTNEELADLEKLLNHHESRIILLQKLSDYRAKGKYYLDQRDFDLLLKYFNIIANHIKANADFHCAEMIIIISQTYHLEILNKTKGTSRKKYIQDDLKNNELFKEKDFWEEFLCYAINKEIMKTQRRDKKIMENKSSTDSKLSNVVFSQLLTIIDNMIEFGFSPEKTREIIEPKINYYKLNDALKLTVNEVLNSKIESEKKKQEKEKEIKLEKEKKEDKKEEKEEKEEKKEEKEEKKEEKEEKKEEDEIKEDRKEEEKKDNDNIVEIKNDELKEEKKEVKEENNEKKV